MIELLAAAAAYAAAPDMAIGRWQTPVRHGIVNVVKCGTSICGSLVESDGLRADPHLKDIKNKNPDKRSRALKGLMILEGFNWKSGAWSGGTIYNADDGATYSATMTPIAAGRIKLKGCIVWPLCKTQVWTRIR